MTTAIKNKLRPADQNIKQLMEAHKASLHRIDKKQTTMKAETADKATGDVALGGTFTPDDGELAQINSFTRKTVSADEVAAFGTMSCNDMFDRDDERFTTDTIKGYAELKAPYSFTGKSFMSDHNYEMSSVRGRIFDTGVEEKDGITFTTNKIYVPKTEQYANYLENVDFGLAWAVSVGVVIDKANCTIPKCGAQVFNSHFFGSWCANGHEKGYFYVPGEEEDDGWGFFVPVDPNTKNAVKAQVDLSDPVDCYELSQVFLGAQFYAELAKKPGFQGIIKAASKSIPVVGLSRKEAAELEIPIPTEPDEVVEARQQFQVSVNEDGEPTWVDDDGLQWVYNVNSDEVVCLGRSAEDASQSSGEVVRADGEVGAEGQDVEDGPDSGSQGSGGDAVVRPEDGPAQLGVGGQVAVLAVSKAAVLAFATKAGFAVPVLDEITADAGSGLEVLMPHVAEAVRLAPLGKSFLKELRAEAIHWYTMAHKTADGAGVNVKVFKKMLDRFEGDVELLNEAIDENKSLAAQRWPAATRRSSFEQNHNESSALEDLPPVPEAKSNANRLPGRVHRS